MRVDNLADHFDGVTPAIHYLELENLKKHFTDKVFVDHGGKIPTGFKIDITEMSLTGSEVYKKM